MSKTNANLSPETKGESEKKKLAKDKQDQGKDVELLEAKRKGHRNTPVVSQRIDDKFHLMVQNCSLDVAMASWLTLKYLSEKIEFYGTDLTLGLIQEDMDYILKHLLENYSWIK